ncbi:MAG: siderophore ABC transporter substrate-binding protein [Pseudomonadota bacterium]
MTAKPSTAARSHNARPILAKDGSWFVALAVAASVAMLFGSGIEASAQETIDVAHAQGEAAVPVNAETIVTFDLATLDILDRLGVPVAGVPAANMPDYLSDYGGGTVPTMGSLFEPDFEALNALQPDLIIVAARSAPQLPALSAIAPTIDLTLDGDDFVGSVTGNVETLGRITGHDEAAAQLVADLNASIEALRQSAANAGDALIVMTSGGRVTAYGPGSRFGWLHDDLGVTPTIEDVEAATHGEAIGFEFILEADPDWLFVVDRDAAIGQGGTAAQAVLDNLLVAETTAWREGRVVYVDSAAWYIVGGGITALGNAIDQVAASFAGG